jgi:hypothetical protein
MGVRNLLTAVFFPGEKLLPVPCASTGMVASMGLL